MPLDQSISDFYEHLPKPAKGGTNGTQDPLQHSSFSLHIAPEVSQQFWLHLVKVVLQLLRQRVSLSVHSSQEVCCGNTVPEAPMVNVLLIP